MLARAPGDVAHANVAQAKRTPPPGRSPQRGQCSQLRRERTRAADPATAPDDQGTGSATGAGPHGPAASPTRPPPPGHAYRPRGPSPRWPAAVTAPGAGAGSAAIATRGPGTPSPAHPENTPVTNDGHPGSPHRSTAGADSPRAGRLTRSERTPTASGALAADSKAAEGQGAHGTPLLARPATTGPARAHVTRALAAVLGTRAAQIKALAAQITEQPGLHADAHLVTSLPRSGTVRAARLLTEIGDRRARFPDPQSLMCLAGGGALHPPVRQGQGRQLPLGRRQAAARRRLRLRRRLPPRQSLGRPALQRRHRSWQKSSPRYPYVARAWLYGIWHCRQDRTAYDPALHKALQRLLEEDKPMALDTGLLMRPAGKPDQPAQPAG